MKLTNNQWYALITFIISLVITYIIYYNLEEEQKNIINLFSIFGTSASLYGLYLAYNQIQGIKETTELTKNAVDKSVVRINQVLSVSEISKASKIIQEIQVSITHNKSELALLRMKDLKQILIQVKYNSELLHFTQNDSYNQNITDLSIDINNVSDLVIEKKKGVNFSKVNQNLEVISTLLSEFENKLKFGNHDT